MRQRQWVHMLAGVGLIMLVQSCAETATTQRMISAHDHNGLASYYTTQAQELREKATQWEFTAEYYDKHSGPQDKTDSAQHAAHCRAIAEDYKKAAAEAEALAQEHRAMRPHGMVQ